MSGRDPIQDEAVPEVSMTDGAELLRPLLQRATQTLADNLPPITGILVGELVAIKDYGCTPLILYPGQAGTAALAARSMIDLHAAHIGKRVVLMFESGDPGRPIVMGVLREADTWPLEECGGQVEVDADGHRLILRAREQLVLHCGKASITLTKAGKVLIQGTYVLSRSTGVNRIKGGSVQIN
jgi:hypothetical protein